MFSHGSCCAHTWAYKAKGSVCIATYFNHTCTLIIYFSFASDFSPLSLNLVTNCTPSVPIAHIAVDTPQQPHRSDFRGQCRFYKPHCLTNFLWPCFRDECKQGFTVYGYPTAPAESSPLPRNGEPIMPLYVSWLSSALGRAGTQNPDPRCVTTAKSMYS